MKTLLVTFVYPLITEFLKEFFSSLDKQTIKDFDTLVFSDKFNEELSLYSYSGEVIKNIENLSISKVRKYIIEYALKKEYDLLIFCDADDIMKEDRVEKLITDYKKTNGEFGFYYNNLYTLEEKKDFYKGNLPNQVNSESKLEKYNFLGMSHTAINLKLTKDIWKDFKVTDDVIAFDWYMHSYILSKGFKGIKVDTITYYRIYENNIAGDTNILNEKKLEIGLRVKKAHYKIMSNIDKKFKKNYNEIEELGKKIENREFKENYIKLINEKFCKNVFWWENIKTIDEIERVE